MREAGAAGRPRAFGEADVLRRAMRLFWTQGFEGSSLADIMAATGLKKGSIYAAFGDKRSLYERALRQYELDVVEPTVALLTDETQDPQDRIMAFLSEPVNAARRNDKDGCFLCNASADQGALDAETAAWVRRNYKRLSNALTLALSAARPDLPLDEAADRGRALMALYSGMRVMGRSGIDADVFERALQAALTGLAR